MSRPLLPLLIGLFVTPFLYAADPLPDGALARLGHARMTVAERGKIHIHPDGKWLACDDAWFDVASGLPIRSPYREPAKHSLWAVFTDGSAAYHQGDTFLILKPNTATPLAKFTVTGWPVFAADGRAVAADTTEGAENAREQVFSTAAVPVGAVPLNWAEKLRVKVNPKRVVYSADVRTAAWQHPKEDEFSIADLTTGAVRAVRLGNNRVDFDGLALSPDGSKLAVLLNTALTVYDGRTGKELRAERLPRGSYDSCAFTPDGRRVFVNNRWGNRRVVSLDPTAATTAVPLRAYYSDDFALFPDSKRVACLGSGVVRIHDLTTGKQTDDHSPHPGWANIRVIGPHTAGCWSESGEVLTWDLRTGKPIRELRLAGDRDHRDHRHGRFRSDGALFAGWVTENRFQVLSVETGKPLLDREDEQHYFSNLSAVLMTNKLIGVTSAQGERRDGTGVCDLLDPATGKPVRRITTIPESVHALAEDGRTLAAATGQCVELYEVASGKRRWRTDNLIAPSAERNSSSANRLEFDRDGRRLFLVRDYDLCVLDAVTGRQEFGLGRDTTHISRDWAWSASGRWAVRQIWKDGKHTFAVYDLDGDKPEDPVLVRDHTGPHISGHALDEDGRRLVTAHYDGTSLVWDLPKWVAPHLRAKKPKAADTRTPWDRLADPDATAAQAGLAALLADPAEAVKLIGDKLPPAAAMPADERTRLIGELADPDFQVREAASKKLAAVADQIEAELQAAVKASANAEQTARLEQVLASLTNLAANGERLRVIRAVEVLERTGTPEARKLLDKYAAGASGATLTREAADALGRRKR